MIVIKSFSAQVVALEYFQEYGIVYEQTFLVVAKFDSINIILSTLVIEDMEDYCILIKNNISTTKIGGGNPNGSTERFWKRKEEQVWHVNFFKEYMDWSMQVMFETPNLMIFQFRIFYNP